MRSIWLFAVFAILTSGTVAQKRGQHGPQGAPRGPMGGAQANPLIRKLLESRDKVKFTGIRVIQHLESDERKIVTERVWRDGHRIKTEATDGPNKGKIAIEDARLRQEWIPADNTVRTSPARENEFFLRFGRMGGFGRRPLPLVESDGGRIAGVMTRLLVSKGPDGKVEAQAWIDPVHGVLLKFQSFDREGRRNSYLEYTNIKFDATFIAGTFRLDKPGAKYLTPQDDLRRFARELGMKPYTFPPQSPWELVAVRKMELKGTKVLMQHFRGRGGRLSLFIMSGNADMSNFGRKEKDGAKAHVWAKDGFKFALIGRLPQEDLRRLADAIRS